MSTCTDFADRLTALGIELPEHARLAVERYRAVDKAIRDIANDPVAQLDITTIEPDQAAEAVTAIIEAEQRRQLVHATVVIRLRERANAAAITAIAGSAEDTIDSLRPVHDDLAVKLTDAARRLRGLDHGGIIQADEATRMAWAQQPDLHRQMREVRGLRGSLTEWGYRAEYSDLTGQQLEELTRHVNPPVGVTWPQVVALYSLMEQGDWTGVLNEGGRLWLPTLNEQRARIEQLRQLKQQRVSA